MSEAQPATHETVKRICGLNVHKRAASHQAFEAERPGFTDRFIGNTPSPETAMQPHAVYSLCAALAYEVDRHTWMCCNEKPVDMPRD